ncbi:MAG: hypothetical protein COA60_005860 [Robiginitomaculum sp.]|nr:hypothetical protein [Robiginitomaculum sp.]
MKHLLLGVVVLFFGFSVGNIGVASAGIGMGIPMIPIGIYLTYRGWRIYVYEQDKGRSDKPMKAFAPLIDTFMGKIGMAIILIFLMISLSSFVLKLPFLLFALWLTYLAFKSPAYSVSGLFGVAK